MLIAARFERDSRVRVRVRDSRVRVRVKAPALGMLFHVAFLAGVEDIRLAQRTALKAIVNQNHMHPLKQIQLKLPHHAIVEPFVAEEPVPDASMLGLEQARKLAAQTSKPALARGLVTWCSALDLGDFWSITAWNSPQISVPHFFWSAGLLDGGSKIALSFDFRPRALAGYETQLADGSFPEPTDRNMFALASTRKELGRLYFTPDSQQWSKDFKTRANAVSPDIPSIPAAPVAGPLRVDVVMPMSEEAVAACCSACESATSLWLKWMQDAEKLDQRRTMTVFAHDAKVRATCLESSSKFFADRYGAEGEAVTLADAGPLDIADRGSAQNRAAMTNFDASERDQTSLDMMKLEEDKLKGK